MLILSKVQACKNFETSLVAQEHAGASPICVYREGGPAMPGRLKWAGGPKEGGGVLPWHGRVQCVICKVFDFEDSSQRILWHKGGVPCAVRALCACCAKSWPFSTTGSSVSSEDWKDVIEWLLQWTGL